MGEEEEEGQEVVDTSLTVPRTVIRGAPMWDAPPEVPEYTLLTTQEIANSLTDLPSTGKASVKGRILAREYPALNPNSLSHTKGTTTPKGAVPKVERD